MSQRNTVPARTDAVIVGAGFSGLYLLYRLRRLGLSAHAFERGSGVGGTWYWNRYPGARCDVESMQYSFSFDEDLQQDWHWPEKFSAQPDILAYINHVADRFDLRKDITFNTSVIGATYDDAAERWLVKTDDEGTVSARYLIMATGCISTAQIPAIDGLENFRGNAYHTGQWPHEPVDFSGQRVAVIGTGSSGIQAIPVIAEDAAHLTVFQRTAHFSVPSQNVPMTDAYEAEWKRNYAARRQEMRYAPGGSMKTPNDVSALEVTPEDRRAVYQQRWDMGGLAFLGSFNDLLKNREANETAAEFVREKIRAIVKDPATAELLAPDTYPIGAKRLCVNAGYYETYNRDNVDLVDISSGPIEKITATGLVANGRPYDFDSIVFATGFDALTGAILRVDIHGRNGLALKDKWYAGPRTYLGLMSASFPNLFLITGPGSPSVKSNMMTSIEQHVDFVADLLADMAERGMSLVEPLLSAEDEWVDHVQDEANKTLFPCANSW